MTASLSELLGWKPSKETGERLKLGAGVGSTQVWEELGWRHRQASLPWWPLQSHPRGASVRGSSIHPSFHPHTNQHFLSTLYILKILSSTHNIYVLSKCWLNEWNLGKQPFNSQLELEDRSWKYVINLHISVDEHRPWWKSWLTNPFQFELWSKNNQ